MPPKETKKQATNTMPARAQEKKTADNEILANLLAEAASNKPVLTGQEQLAYSQSQLEQAMETFRTQYNLVVQIGVALAVADVTVIGFAITTQIAGLMFIGVVFPVLMEFIMGAVDRRMKPIIFAAVAIEHKYKEIAPDGLASTFIAQTISQAYLVNMRNILQETNYSVRMKKLKQLKGSVLNVEKRRLMFAVIITGNLLLPFLLSTLSGWRFL